MRMGLGAVVLAVVMSAASGQDAARQVYVNAVVHTMDDANPRATALAVEGARVLAVGNEDEVRRVAGGQARVIDLGGRTVLPGLIDAHGHMSSLGVLGLGGLDLRGTRSLDDLVARAHAAASKRPAGEWVTGRGWDHEGWPGAGAGGGAGGLPTHHTLSGATPDHPVWLRRVDGHAGLANRRAMELAGITRDTQSPEGGEIIKDERGEPTGVFVDNAMSLIGRHVRGPGQGGPGEVILKAQEMCLSVGLTGVHDMGVEPADIAEYQRLEREGRLKLRVYALLSASRAVRWFDELAPTTGERLTVRGAKLYMDGAMGSRGAWLLEPYADRPAAADGSAYTGLAVSRVEFIESVARHAREKGYQVCTHAIGDRANREVLGAYERALSGGGAGGRADHRFRIEHAQLLHADDIPRIAALGVIASMQPTHATSDMRWVEARVGPERAKGAYAWATLLNGGAKLAAGSDFPVESHNPFLGLYAAVTRQNKDGHPKGGWQPQERMTRRQALHAFTLGAAYAGFEEGSRGSLAPGKLADFIVVDRDIMTCPEGEIAGTRVLRTVVGGEVVWGAP